jgi:hypothetical protein
MGFLSRRIVQNEREDIGVCWILASISKNRFRDNRAKYGFFVIRADLRLSPFVDPKKHQPALNVRKYPRHISIPVSKTGSALP